MSDTGTMNIRELFSLKDNTDAQGTIDLLTDGIEFRGTNLWLLVLAMLIASIGLNVDSTAVIIGAMLISPLMGPIAGAGLALGTFNITLLKRAAINLAIMTGISITASTIYFLLTPVQTAGSELLARTSPTFFDVLIAITGGSALIIATSRKSRSANTLAGVAIATALMPPLCTAGYGLARGNFAFMAGALYLYLINSLFIGMAVFVFTKYLRLPSQDQGVEFPRKHLIITLVGIGIFVAPSLWLAWDMADRSAFEANATRFVDQAFQFDATSVLKVKAERGSNGRRVIVTTAGSPITEGEITALSKFLPQYQLTNTSLVVIQGSSTTPSTQAASAPATGTISTTVAPSSDIPVTTTAPASSSGTPALTMESVLAAVRQQSTTQAGTTPGQGRAALLASVQQELTLLWPELTIADWGGLDLFPDRPVDTHAEYRLVVTAPASAPADLPRRLESWFRLRLGTERLTVQGRRPGASVTNPVALDQDQASTTP